MKSSKTYFEGFQQIIFDAGWDIVKIDQHRYYNHVKGQGLKACDFIAYHRDWGLVLIELKDYSKTDELPTDLPLLLSRKYEDTLRLIRAIHVMLMRKWYIRFFASKAMLFKLLPNSVSKWIYYNRAIESGEVLLLNDVVLPNKYSQI